MLGIIPARYASTRFPGKPLALIGGISMIERVYRQAEKSELLSEVLVATDDQKIFDHVVSFGGNVMMTSPDHQSGTDRCAEVISRKTNSDIVINIQGDEPFIYPQQIDQLVQVFAESETQIATLIKKIGSKEELANPNIPKVVIQKNRNALYFSRSVIPFSKANQLNDLIFYKHIGIYGYRTEILIKLSVLKQSPLEIAESLEQLRWLENGYEIKTALTEFENYAVDSPEDVQKVELRFKLK